MQFVYIYTMTKKNQTRCCFACESSYPDYLYYLYSATEKETIHSLLRSLFNGMPSTSIRFCKLFLASLVIKENFLVQPNCCFLLYNREQRHLKYMRIYNLDFISTRIYTWHVMIRVKYTASYFHIPQFLYTLYTEYFYERIMIARFCLCFVFCRIYKKKTNGAEKKLSKSSFEIPTF